MFLLPKIESVFSIVIIFDKMEYKFKNEVVLEVLKKLVITAINSLVYYLIVKVSYARLLLITKLIFIGIEFESPGEASYTYDGPAKLGKKTRPS